MDIRLIALDLDGTLLNDNGVVPEENIRLLRAFADHGALIVLSSGRMTDCVAPFADRIGLDCPLIVYNGAMARGKSAEGRPVICHDPLPSVHADRVLDYCGAGGFCLNYYLDDVLYSWEDVRRRRYTLIYSRQTGAVYHFLPDLRLFRGSRPTKLILITDACHPDAARTRDFQYERLASEFGKDVHLVKTNPEYLEFLHRAANKGAALERLARFYGIPRRHTVAFGDGENDIEMLVSAGVGVAMANAKERVKKAADCVLEWDNNEAGVAKFLQQHL